MLLLGGPDRPAGELARAEIVYGISGEQPAAFRDPRLRALGLRYARAQVSWDLAVRGPRDGDAPDPDRFPALAHEHARLLALLADARAAGIRDLLIAVKPSRERPGLRPSPARYARSVRVLLDSLERRGAGDLIRSVSPWNEPNLSSATRDSPQVAGAYYGAVRDICAGRGCTPVAGEFADRPLTPGFLAGYLEGAGSPRPRIWAWHAYEDGWDRRGDPRLPRLRTLLSAIPGGAEVWLTEQGGIVRRHAPGDDGRREQSEGRASADLEFLLERAPALDTRIKRFYLYQWQGERAPRWDSGVVAPEGRVRAGYCVFAEAAASRVPPAC